MNIFLPLYQSLIVLLLVIGLVPALIFLGQHRPRQWKRLAAWDASGWVLVCTFFYVRSLVLLILRWPGTPPQGWPDAIVSVGLLVVADTFLIVRMISYRAFVEADKRLDI
jgi:hypothetical protein